MGRQLTEREVARFNRVLSGHLKDKDRARRKRRLSGQATPAASKGSAGARPKKRLPAPDAEDDLAAGLEDE